MKVLFIGGTGNISTSCSLLTLEKGIDLYHLNRGVTKEEIPGVISIKADIHNKEETLKAIGDHDFDVVVDWIAFIQDDVKRDYEIFKGKVKQFIFISSASAYQKPLSDPRITESTPLANPVWEYSQNKIACEDYLLQKYREEGFPITIVRPSHTYRNVFPVAVGDWRGYWLIDRIKNRKKIVVHGDGTSLWVLTHSEDFAKGFVGLLGNIHAIGHAFHITSDELLTWNQIYEIIADIVGMKANLIHIPSDFIMKYDSETGAGLWGDKAYSVIFDNTKIKTFVPEFKATIPFTEGIKKVLNWFDEDETRKKLNPKDDEYMDNLINSYLK
ncbi:GDP-L-fucose synthase [subsurface metagenome]|jgi:nucleoside-diphosphate-sugar epimerase|nr:NAD-dependent epimerase/dehydratase family protein [Clostridia bacterium]